MIESGYESLAALCNLNVVFHGEEGLNKKKTQHEFKKTRPRQETNSTKIKKSHRNRERHTMIKNALITIRNDNMEGETNPTTYENGKRENANMTKKEKRDKKKI